MGSAEKIKRRNFGGGVKLLEIPCERANDLNPARPGKGRLTWSRSSPGRCQIYGERPLVAAPVGKAGKVKKPASGAPQVKTEATS
jgi:hypothetical protein